MPGVVFSRGERVTLQTIEEEDAEVTQRAYNEPDFQEGFPLLFPKSQRTIEERIEETIDGEDDSIYLLICVDENPVGQVSLQDMRRFHGMLAYWVLPEERGHGYATEGAALLVDHTTPLLVVGISLQENQRGVGAITSRGNKHGNS